MYGDCIALSFCEGCHVSHDRRLVWEAGQKSSNFFAKKIVLRKENPDHRLCARGTLSRQRGKNQTGVDSRRGLLSLAYSGVPAELEES